MEQHSPVALSPHRIFTRSEWAKLRADAPLTLTVDDVTRLKSLNDPISLDDVIEIYLPLSRLLSLYVAAAQGLFDATRTFLGARDGQTPFIIGVPSSAAGRIRRRSISSPPTASSSPTPSWRGKG
jgi:type I pantothenate kinase